MGIQSPPLHTFLAIAGILAILILYGIFAAWNEAHSPWIVFGISILILCLPLIAIGAEAYHYYELVYSQTTNL